MFGYVIWIWIWSISVVYSSTHKNYNINGITTGGWEFVRDLFRENFAEQRDLGASIAVYHQGEPVIDLSGGWFDHSLTKTYDNNTLQLVFSTTKGLVAIATALCVQKGLLNYSELVTKYWPEYGMNGKENTTVADILSHRAGLPNDPDPIERALNWTSMVKSLEEAQPLWLPGTAHSYHALTYGWLAGELIRRVDAKKRTMGQFIRDEIANRLKLEFYVGLPSEQLYRVSPLTHSVDGLRTMNDSMKGLYIFFNSPYVQQAEIPAANGITNARSIARLYASLMTDLDHGKEKRLLTETVLKQAAKSNTPKDELDFITGYPSSYGMGFSLLDRRFPFFKTQIIGHQGIGGSIGFAIPSKNLSFAYVMNQLRFEAENNRNDRVRIILEQIATKIGVDF